MRLLFVEDNPDDLELICAELRRFGFAFEHGRVDSLDALRLALEVESWSAVLSDYNLAGFTGIDALHVVREYAHDLPFLLVSSHLGEELAVDAIRAGVNDYVMKDRIGRLGPAVERELRDVQLRDERRALFHAFRRSEDRYRRIFEKAPVGVAVTTPAGDILNVNERLAVTLGHTRQELIGLPIYAFVHPDDGQAAFAAERRYVRKDGEVVWTRVTIASVNADDLTVEQLVWLIEDVTEQRQQELELRSQREQLAEAQRLARLGSYELDLLTRRCTWSDELCHIYGIAPGPAPDLTLADTRIHPDDQAWVVARRRQILRDQQPFELEHRLLLPAGEIRLLSGRGRFLFDDAGRAVKVMGIVHDVTEARAQEDELQRRAMQQVVVANLGQAALAGEPTDALLGQAAEIVTHLLDVEICHILEATPNDRFRLVGGSGWHEDIVMGAEVQSSALAKYTIDTGAPVIVDDLLAETRFVPSPFLLRQEVVSGMAVPISTGRMAPWGVLGAHTRVRRTFTSTEVDFLRGVATVLAQAFERDRVDQQLVLHAAQQTAIAELSQIALRSVDDAIVVVCDLVRSVLEVRDAEFIRGEDVVCGGGLTADVASADARFGVLCAGGKHGEIHEGDLEFLQSLANILAEAMERERSACALARSEERLREVIAGVSEVIFTMSLDGTFTSLNPAFEQITGWSSEEWIGRSYHELFLDEDVEPANAALRHIVELQQSVHMEFRVRGRHGVVLLDCTSFPKVETGRTTRIYGSARDITAARRAELQRQDVTRSLQLLLESTVEGILTADLEGRCTMWNRAARDILGLADSEISGADVQTLLFGTRPSHPILSVAQSGEVRTMARETFVGADGATVPVEYSAAPIVDSGVPVGVVVSFSDITDRRKLEVKLEQADRLTSLGRLAATIAHEFNNVLMGISPFVEVLRRGKNVESSLDHIGRAVKRGKRITQDILRFTQPAQPVRAAFDVASWIENITIEARTLLPPQCAIQTTVAAGLHLDGDANQLQQIFTNLVLNARDAMADGGTLTIEAVREAAGARLPFPVEHPERLAHFVVRDTGCGISDETLRHIFEPLFTTKKNGTGLGLPVTHQVVQRHGGEIFVESTPGVGTAFHIFLPLSEETEMRAAEPAADAATAVTRQRVLLVEDDRSVATGLVSILELEGLCVDVAENGAEAIHAVNASAPDVVVLDVGLPDMEGTSVYNVIAAQRPNLPIIFSTGHADRGKLDDLLERPHVAYLLKPYECSALLGAIRDVTQA